MTAPVRRPPRSARPAWQVGLRVRETLSQLPAGGRLGRRASLHDAKAHPRKVDQHYTLVPTICFNCESACGLLAYVDQETFEVRKLEGNPRHPGCRGRNCAKGPATINQINDPERILHPLRRRGPRGGGEWERVSWDHVLDDIRRAHARAFVDGRPNDVMYYVGRPGEDGFADRFLETWGCDGHNCHTNVCSVGRARSATALWMAATDRPSPDYANAQFIAADLQPTWRRATTSTRTPSASWRASAERRPLAVIDPRLSNTASMADHWLATWPGTEAAMLLAIASVPARQGPVDRDFVRRWVNWRTYLAHRTPTVEPTFEASWPRCSDDYAATPSSTPRPRAASRRSTIERASPSEVAAAAPARRRTSGARRRPATWAAGRSPARCGCSPC